MRRSLNCDIVAAFTPYTLNFQLKNLHIRKFCCIFVNDCKSMRDAHDSKQLSLKQFAYLCEKMVEVEDQLKKWKTYYR